MNISELRDRRNNLWASMKSFLDTRRESNNGVLTAEDDATYSKMEKDLDALTNEIMRSERAASIENELNKPVSTPLTAKPEANKAVKEGRASDEYKNAFWNALRSKVMTSSVYDALQIGTASEGGYLVPDEFERQLIDKLAEENVLRQLATVIKTSGDRKIPVIASHGTATIIAEEGAYTESDDAFAQIVIGAFKIGTMMRVSEELLNDSAFNLESYISSEFARRCGAAEENYFLNGTGSGQPVGLLAATGGADTGVTAANANKIAADEVIDLFYSVKAPYRRNGVWVMNDATVKELRKFKSGDGQYLWQPAMTAGTPDTLLNRPVYTSAYMPTIATGAKTIAFGDMKYFWIADRSDWEFRRLNELYAANGQVGFKGYERVDGKLTLSEAVKVLVQA